MTDRRSLHQILINLTNNAIKYTDRGEIRIEIHKRQAPEGLPKLEINVADTGIGIGAEQQARLFQAFEQLDPSNTRRFEGAGLGLYLSQKLALLLGGEIHFTSTPGEGSVFTVTLPIEA